MTAESFFSESEKQRIAETIARVERKTSGEIAVMVVDKSDSYPESELLAGLLPGALLSLPVSDYFFGASLWTFFPLWLGMAFLGWFTARHYPGLKKIFLFQRRMDEMVQRCALRSFYEKELYRTRDKTGVLFFISLFERRVWILADKGIYEKVEQEGLQRYATGIAKGIRQGMAADVLCRQMEQIGSLLAENFPVRSDDVNELPDTVITN